jgi:protein-tyrosine-phosphatase
VNGPPADPADPAASPSVGAGASLLVLCTGNAARSVMAGYMLDRLAKERALPLSIVSAGTHTINGQPMSVRTRVAIASVPALADAPVSRHRSRQLRHADLDRAQLVVAMEADHVRYIRRRHAEAADRTAVIRSLVDRLEPPAPGAPETAAPCITATSLAERVRRLDLASAPLDDADDVIDPAGREQDAYLACAAELWQLCTDLVDRL